MKRNIIITASVVVISIILIGASAYYKFNSQTEQSSNKLDPSLAASIMTDEISKLSDLIDLSKKTMRIVRENIIFAICIKVIVLVLCAVGLSNMWEAVFADVGVSIIAIINALRMLNVKRKA